MTADQHIAEAATRAAIAYRNGDDLLGDYWTERVTRLSDQREADRVRVEHSPDHSVVRHG